MDGHATVHKCFLDITGSAKGKNETEKLVCILMAFPWEFGVSRLEMLTGGLLALT